MKPTNFTEDIVYQWQKNWDKHDLQQSIENCQKDTVCLPYFLKYLPKEGAILEAGCGLGHWVIYLSRLGYNMTGVEIVPDCVERCKKYFPEADIRIGDVRNLPFPDNYFSGYISMGVIEHMIEGPETTLKEMRRVLKPNGITIVMVPAFNYFLRVWYPIRNSLVKLFRYNRWIRKILHKPEITLDKGKIQSKFDEINRQLRKEFYPTVGLDPEIGPVFIEYKYPKGRLEDFLRKFNIEVIECVSIFSPCVFQSVFGNFTCDKTDKFKLNVVGKILQYTFNHLSRHFFNSHYLCVGKMKD